MPQRAPWCYPIATGFLSLLVSCAAPRQPALELPPAPPRGADRSGTVGEAESNQQIRRRAEEAYGIRCLKQAEAELAADRYRQAIPLFTDAVRYLGGRAETTPHQARAATGLAEAYYQWARRLLQAGDLKQAAEYGRRAAGYGHPKADELLSRIAKHR